MSSDLTTHLHTHNHKLIYLLKCQPTASSQLSDISATNDESKPVVFTNIPESAETTAPSYNCADDEIVNNYSNMIEEATRLREDAIAGTISDEVRRNKAAEFALKFAQMMNFDDDNSDDD